MSDSDMNYAIDILVGVGFSKDEACEILKDWIRDRLRNIIKHPPPTQSIDNWRKGLHNWKVTHNEPDGEYRRCECEICGDEYCIEIWGMPIREGCPGIVEETDG